MKILEQRFSSPARLVRTLLRWEAWHSFFHSELCLLCSLCTKLVSLPFEKQRTKSRTKGLAFVIQEDTINPSNTSNCPCNKAAGTLVLHNDASCAKIIITNATIWIYSTSKTYPLDKDHKAPHPSLWGWDDENRFASPTMQWREYSSPPPWSKNRLTSSVLFCKMNVMFYGVFAFGVLKEILPISETLPLTCGLPGHQSDHKTVEVAIYFSSLPSQREERKKEPAFK